MKSPTKISILALREALEASWDSSTSNLGVSEKGNPALGQCYPTSWVVQHFFPATEIVEGQVWTGKQVEKHFWNVLNSNGDEYHVDLTWQQFPPGSSVQSFRIRDRKTLGDGPSTVKRCTLLLDRVTDHLSRQV
jgi:hypothetical protein